MAGDGRRGGDVVGEGSGGDGSSGGSLLGEVLVGVGSSGGGWGLVVGGGSGD